MNNTDVALERHSTITHLWPAIRQYNEQAFNAIDPSWFSDLEHVELLMQLADCNRSQPLLIRHFIDQLAIKLSPDYDFVQKQKRILLIDTPVLRQLILLAGLTVHHLSLAQIIDGSAVRRLRSAIGETYYLFIIKKAPFLFTELPDFKAVKPLNLCAPPEHLKEQLEISGCHVLCSVLATVSRNTIQRVLLKLPRHWEKYCKPFNGTSTDKAHSFTLLARLTQETSPPCHHLFA